MNGKLLQKIYFLKNPCITKTTTIDKESPLNFAPSILPNELKSILCEINRKALVFKS